MAIPDFFQISSEVTHVLANARDSRESIKAILRLLTRSLAWDFGQLWIVDDRRFVLSCVACWPSGSFPKFEQVSMARSFSLGEGLPGSAWQERQCLWKTDVREERNFPRASVAKEEGITSGLAFPLHVPEGVLGVMELFSRDERAPDQPVIDFCSALGGQIGVFLEHARLKSELKELDSQLRVLAEGASDAILTIDEHSTILFANSGVYRTFGYTPQELIGKKLTMLMPPEMAHRHELGIQRFVKTASRNIPGTASIFPDFTRTAIRCSLQSRSPNSGAKANESSPGSQSWRNNPAAGREHLSWLQALLTISVRNPRRK